VPLEVAERIAAERDAALGQFDRVRQQLEAFHRRLAAREEENRQLRQAVVTLQQRPAAPDPGASRREASAQQALMTLRERNDQLEELLQRTRAQIDGLVAERDVASAEGDAARAALERAEVQLSRCPETPSAVAHIEQLAADLANVRRHQEEEIAAGVRREHSRLIEGVGGIRDTLERARAMLPADGSPWAEGLTSTRRAIDRILAQEGVHLVGEPGERFDPNVHQAIALGSHPEGVADLVVAVHQAGLVYEDGGLIRPAQVTVSASGPDDGGSASGRARRG
jgi:molecular chaperone GrpE